MKWKRSLPIAASLAGILSLKADLNSYDAAIEADHAGNLPYAALSREVLTFDTTNGVEFDFGDISESATIEFIVSGDPDEAINGYFAVGENTTWNLRYEQWRDLGSMGFTHLGVRDYVFTAVDDADESLLESPVELTHVTYRWDQPTTTMDLYVNGVLVGTNNEATDYEMPTGSGFLGARDAGGSEGMFGTIERVTVYDEALDPSVIQAHADAWVGASDPGVVVSDVQDFGELLFINAPQELRVPVRNSGTTNDLTLEARITGGAHFTIVSAPDVIAPGMSGDIVLQFERLGALGQFTGTLEITSNDPDPFDRTLTLTLRAALIDREGPIAHYRFDEPVGASVMPDATGFGKNGMYDAGVMLGAEALVTGTAMAVNGGLASIPGSHFENLEAFTLSLWVQAEDIAGTQTLIAKGNESSPAFAVIVDGGVLQWFLGAEPEFQSDEPVISANTAHHVAVTYSAAKATLYVDGIAVGERDAPSPLEISMDNPFMIGSFNNALPFAGRLDDFQIYDRSLSAQQVRGLHDDPGSVVTSEISEQPGIAAHWTFDETLSDTAPGGTGDVLAPTGEVAFARGVMGEAVRLSADGMQRLRAEDSDDLDLADDWTLEAYVWPDADNTGEWDRFWTKWGDGGNEWHVAFRSAGAVTVENGLDLFINGDRNVIPSNTTAEVPLEEWSHVALVGNATEGTITAWLNGLLVGEAAYEEVQAGSGAMNFGNFESPANGLQFSGLIDEAIIHRLARDESYLLDRASRIIRRPPGGSDALRESLGRVAGSTETLTEPAVVDFGDLTGDATYEFFFNAVQGGPSTAIAGDNDWGLKLEQWQSLGIFGTTEFGVVDNAFDPVAGGNVDSVFGEDVHVIFVNDSTAGETRLYINGNVAGTIPSIFELAGEVSVMAAHLGNIDLMGEGSVFYGWSTYDEALPAEAIALLAEDALGLGGGETDLILVQEVQRTANNVLQFTLPAGINASIQYSRDLLTWETILTGVSGMIEDSDALRNAETSGYYRAQVDSP